MRSDEIQGTNIKWRLTAVRLTRRSSEFMAHWTCIPVSLAWSIGAGERSAGGDWTWPLSFARPQDAQSSTFIQCIYHNHHKFPTWNNIIQWYLDGWFEKPINVSWAVPLSSFSWAGHCRRGGNVWAVSQATVHQRAFVMMVDSMLDKKS